MRKVFDRKAMLETEVGTIAVRNIESMDREKVVEQRKEDPRGCKCSYKIDSEESVTRMMK